MRELSPRECGARRTRRVPLLLLVGMAAGCDLDINDIATRSSAVDAGARPGHLMDSAMSPGARTPAPEVVADRSARDATRPMDVATRPPMEPPGDAGRDIGGGRRKEQHHESSMDGGQTDGALGLGDGAAALDADVAVPHADAGGLDSALGDPEMSGEDEPCGVRPCDGGLSDEFPSDTGADADEECDGGSCCTGDGGCSATSLCVGEWDPRCVVAGGIAMAGRAVPDATVTYTYGEQEFVTMTGADGHYELQLPLDRELVAFYEHPALYGLLSYVFLPRGVPLSLDLNMWWQEALDELAGIHGSFQDPDKGAVWVLRTSPLVGGEGIVLDRSSDPSLVSHPGGGWDVAPTMNAEGESDQLFTNVDPGVLHPSMLAPEGTHCGIYSFVGGFHPAAFAYEVRPRTVTFLLFSCEAAEP